MRVVVSTTRKARQKQLAVLVLLILAVSQGCLLTTETPRFYNVYNSYTCRATLMDTNTGELRTVVSSMLATAAPGAAQRRFLSFDWDDNGESNDSDALLDWRRYLRNDVSTSTNFTGRSWCVNPTDTSCTDPQRYVWRSLTDPVPLPAEELPNCSGISGPQLEVTAPGLSSDNQFAFPDSAVGTAGSTSVLFTVTNRSSLALRVNGINLMAGADIADFVKEADACAPTAAEMIAGRSHLLASGAACTFQMRFSPEHRDGVPECSPTSPNELCRRRASLFVTGEEDSSRASLRPVNVAISGRAIGGSLSIVPGEVCFASAPAVGDCTPFQNLRITNTSGADLTLTSARLTRAGNRWEATMPFLMPLTLPAGLSIDVPVRFCNVANDPTDGEFTINSSSPTNPTTVVTLVNPLNRRCP